MSVPEKYRGMVGTALKAAAAAGVPGAFSFGADIAGIAAIWGGLIVAVAKKSGHEIDGKYAAKIAGSVIASVAGYLAGIKIASNLFHLIPGAGTAAAIGLSTALNIVCTYKFSLIVIKHFETKALDLGSFASSVAYDLLAVMSVWTLFSDLKEATELATTFGRVPSTLDGSPLRHKTVEEFMRLR